MGTMTVLTTAGDITVEWKPDDPESVAQAKAEWDRLKEDGYEFFAPAEGGGKGKRLKRWDAKRGWVMAAPGVRRTTEAVAGKHRGTARREKRPAAMAGGPNDRRFTLPL